MHSHLYFICPTDHLEPVINNTFQRENYFLTSLGNSITFDIEMTLWLSEFLRTRHIDSITFVLSEDNRIVQNEPNNKSLSGISGIRDFHKQIARQQKSTEERWQSYNDRLMTLSYHLNSKIKQLRQELASLSMESVRITGKIYRRNPRGFRHIYPDLICADNVCVN